MSSPEIITRSQKLQGYGIGMLLSAGISMALVISTAKAGISPGVSPLVVLIGWVTVGRILGGRLKGFLAIAQVTGSGGAAVSAGAVFTAPIVQVYFRGIGGDVPPVDVAGLTLACFAGALIGWGLVGSSVRRYLTDPRLPAPEAVACDRLIRTATENPEARPPMGRSLIAGLLGAVGFQYLVTTGRLVEEVARVPFLWLGPRSVQAELPIAGSPLLLGIGALLTVPTAILIFCGAVVHSVTAAVSESEALPDDTYRWVGGAAMTVAVLFSLGHYIVTAIRERRGSVGEPSASVDTSLLDVSAGMRWALRLSVIIGTGLFFLVFQRAAGDQPGALGLLAVALALCFFLCGLGALLSLQVGASASPVSGTVFMALLVISLTALQLGFEGSAGVLVLVPILVTVCVAICAANDSSQDYKTMQFNGYRVSDGFVGQLLGLLVGAITVPLALALANGPAPGSLGTELYECPQARFFGTVLTALFIDGKVPTSAVAVGAGLGVVAVIIEIVGKRKGVILSSLAFAVGVYLPAQMGVGILLGSAARFVGTRRLGATTHAGLLTAAGLISGYALLALVRSVLLTTSWKLEPGPGVTPFSPLGSAFILVGMLALIAYNFRRPPTSEG